MRCVGAPLHRENATECENERAAECAAECAYGCSVSRVRTAYLWGELLALFGLVPVVVALLIDPQRRGAALFDALGLDVLNEIARPTRLLMPLLFFAFLAVLLTLVFARSFPKAELWNWHATRAELRALFARFGVLSIVMVMVAVALASLTEVMTITGDDGTRTALFRLPRELPLAVPLIFVFYPWFSVYPQEVICRPFFFWRYRAILRSDRAMVAVNALAFSWIHAPFWHWMALALTFPGGLLFAITYLRTKSTLAVTIEHGLLGWWAFVVGLGWFVFTGSIGGS